MQKQFKEKYNKSCIKIFKLLELLNNGEAEYERVIEILNDGEMQASDNLNGVLINKYMNTLKVFGVDVKKIGSKYVIRKLPFSSNLSLNDLKIIKKFRQIQASLPNSKTTTELGKFLTSLEERFDDKTALIYANLNINDKDNYNLSLEMKNKIELCEKYCAEKYRVDVRFKKNDKIVTELCNAKQVLYSIDGAVLRIYKEKENELEDIEVSKIISIEQLPSVKYEIDSFSTVIYTLKGRLAKAYKLKENEYLSKVNNDGSIVVVNKNEPTDALLKRLIRYDTDCFINSPKSLRIKIKNLVDDILKNYEE